MRDVSKQINFENCSDWPICKMSIREILEKFGAKLNEDTHKYEIDDSNVLDIFPLLLEDDGMGYGVNQQYITEVNYYPYGDKPYCSIFRDDELPNIDKWLEAHTHPWHEIEYDGIEYCVTKITKEENGEYKVELSTGDRYNIKRYISYDELVEIVNKEIEERKNSYVAQNKEE